MKCRKCNMLLNADNWADFPKRRNGNICKLCANKYSLENYHKNQEHRKAVNKIWRTKNRERIQKKSREQYRINTAQKLAYSKKYAQKVKVELVSHYAPDMRCQCEDTNCWHQERCTVNNLRILTMEHPNGGGNKQRKQLAIQGTTFYLWLRRNNYPEGFQVLCMNCNWMRRYMLK